MAQLDSTRMMMYMIALVENPIGVIINIPDADKRVLCAEHGLIADLWDDEVVPTEKGIEYVAYLKSVPVPDIIEVFTFDFSDTPYEATVPIG